MSEEANPTPEPPIQSAAKDDSASVAESGDRLNLRQAADFLGISPARMNRLRRQGEIPAARAGWFDWRFLSKDLMAYVERAAGIPAPPEEPSASGPARPIDASIADVSRLIGEFGLGIVEPEEAGQSPLADEAPIVRMVNAILVNGIDARASDIHIEPDRNCFRVRLRIDGSLQHVMTLPRHIHLPVVNRIKVMADIEMYKRALPHRGSIPITWGEKQLQVRVSVMPSLYGEAVVMHVLHEDMFRSGLVPLGLAPEEQRQVEEWASRPSGLVLFAGSAGSGLTTTAFSLLKRMDSVSKNICTFEEATEYHLGGVAQTFRLPADRLSVAEGVEALLRQNPDILFLGDLREAESARCAVDAALSGVLVLATIAAPNSFEAIRRLIRFGIPPSEAAQAVIGVLGQRLVYRICETCKEPYTVAATSLGFFGYSATCGDEPVTIYRGAGCEACRNSGRNGRTGIFEALTMSDELRELVTRGASRDDLKRAAQAAGYRPLMADGLNKMLSGVTTPDALQAAAIR